MVAVALALLCAVGSIARAESFHTDPSCWAEPRVYRTGAPSPELAAHIRVEAVKDVTPPGEVTRSPNGVYGFWIVGTELWVDTERGRGVKLTVTNAVPPLTARWINENLLYVRIVFGRITFVDLVVDVEQAKIVHQEELRDGTITLQQYRDSCPKTGGCECIAAAAPERPASVPGSMSVIGLLELPSVLNHDVDPAVTKPPDVPRRPIPVFSDAAGGRKKLRELGKASDFHTAEHTYEGESVVVYQREPGWYRVALGADGEHAAWVRAEDAGTFRPIAQLLTDGFSYLDADWDGQLWDAPGTGSVRPSKKKTAAAREEYAMDVDETREIDGGLWLHVRLYANDPCEDGDDTIAEEGWVPAYTASGALTAWFWSRGC